MGYGADDRNHRPLENAVLAMLAPLRKMAPPIIVGAVAIIFGLGVYQFVQAYSGFRAQKKRLETIQVRVDLITAQKDELALKQKILNQTVQFINKANALGLSPDKWTFYDVNLQEAVSFDKADQIINQCYHSQVAYYQPLTLHIKTTPKDTPAADSATAGKSGDLTLTVQGKFVARQP